MMNQTPATPIQRFWRLIGLMAIVAALAVAGALLGLYAYGTQLRLHVALATSLGVGLTVMIAGVLMGLVFFSSRSGHDEAAYDETRDGDEF